MRPLPLQERGIPLWIAGGGEKVTLRIAAQYAQYTNFAGHPEEFAAQERTAARALRDGRHRLRGDHAVVNFNTIVGRDEAEVADRIAAIEARLGAVPRRGARPKRVADYARDGLASARPSRSSSGCRA